MIGDVLMALIEIYNFLSEGYTFLTITVIFKIQKPCVPVLYADIECPDDGHM
jgi:hypothetical protein